MTQSARPAKKVNPTPLKETDKFAFLPYVHIDEPIRPFEVEDYTHDSMAVEIVNTLRQGKKWKDMDFTGVNFKGADLSGLDLSEANFSKTNLSGVNFKDCNLQAVDFSYAYFEQTDLSDADLSGACLDGIFYRDCNIEGAQLDEKQKHYIYTLEWLIEQIESGKIDISMLSQEDLNMLDLRLLDLSKVDLSKVDLSAFDLTGVNLSGTYISKLTLFSHESMFKLQEKTQRFAQMNQKMQALMVKKMAVERESTFKAFAKKESKRKDNLRALTKQTQRPDKKRLPDENQKAEEKNAPQSTAPKVVATAQATQQTEPQITVINKQPQQTRQARGKKRT